MTNGNFKHIVSQYQRMIFTIVVKIVHNPQDAEDITQEIFIKIYNSLDKFRNESEFSTWLYRIAYNTTLSEIRKRKIVCSSFEDNWAGLQNVEISESIDDLDKEERIQCLEKALKTLPTEDALLITLFYLNEQTIDQISQITSLSQSNVKVRLHRIRKKLAFEINKLMSE